MTRTPRLTEREVSVIQLIDAGMSDEDGAKALGVTRGTFRKHLDNVLRKLQLSGRVALAVYWNCELFRVGLKELGYLQRPLEENPDEK